MNIIILHSWRVFFIFIMGVVCGSLEVNSIHCGHGFW